MSWYSGGFTLLSIKFGGFKFESQLELMCLSKTLIQVCHSSPRCRPYIVLLSKAPHIHLYIKLLSYMYMYSMNWIIMLKCQEHHGVMGMSAIQEATTKFVYLNYFALQVPVFAYNFEWISKPIMGTSFDKFYTSSDALLVQL